MPKFYDYGFKQSRNRVHPLGAAIGELFSGAGHKFADDRAKEKRKEEQAEALRQLLRNSRPPGIGATTNPHSFPTDPTQEEVQSRHIFSEQNLPQLQNLMNTSPETLTLLQLVMGEQEKRMPKYDIESVDPTKNLYLSTTDYGKPPQLSQLQTGVPEKQDIPGFSQMSPETQAQTYNAQYGTTFTAKDFANQFRPPSPVVVYTASGPQLLNKGTGTASPITGQEGQPVGMQPTSEMRNRDFALGRVDPILSGISELSEKINTGNGVIAKIAGGVERAKAQANLNDDVAEYEALISGFTPMIARAVGHTGVLTEQDVQSVRKLFPSPGDSKSLRDRKISRIKTILGAIRNDAQVTPKDEDFNAMTDEELQEYINRK